MKSWAATICAVALTIGTAAAAEKSGRLEGTIIGRDNEANQLIVKHGDVAGIMDAMTMPYEVRGARVTSLPKNGAAIVAVLHEDAGKYWLTDVRPAEQAPAQHDPMGAMPPAHQQAAPPPEPIKHPEGAMPGMQHEHGSMPAMQQGTQHGAMAPMRKGDATSELLMRQASGTSMNPAAAPMHMLMFDWNGWSLMAHGLAFVNQVFQSGPRGGDKLFSTNWVMGMADRPLGGGHLMLRTMLSLEPATVGRKYPELFQTGETIGGRPIVDAQHPHDFFMEVAAEYAHPITATTIGYVYAAPVGDPSLGPVAYPHRASSSEIPQATLSHHVQDSTHIASSVVTLGAQGGPIGYSFSGFHGREPDENRWNIDSGAIDSWAARVTYDPSPNWTAQVSTGHLRHPEAAEPGNVQRTTASVAYSGATGLGQWDTSLIFGHNAKTEGHGTSSWLAESVLQFGGRNYVTGRAEIVDKDELFAAENVPPAIADSVFRIRALTLGYSRDLVVTRSFSGAAGVNATRYSVPSAIRPYYGSSPHSLYVFIRLRGGAAGNGMHSMGM